jgi:hypothetical protein
MQVQSLTGYVLDCVEYATLAFRRDAGTTPQCPFHAGARTVRTGRVGGGSDRSRVIRRFRGAGHEGGESRSYRASARCDRRLDRRSWAARKTARIAVGRIGRHARCCRGRPAIPSDSTWPHRAARWLRNDDRSRDGSKFSLNSPGREDPVGQQDDCTGTHCTYKG